LFCKLDSRKRWLELRSLWNEFDPIGVYGSKESDWPLDEYESYCGPCMRLLEQGTKDHELEATVHSALDHMGVDANYKEIKEFVRKMQIWFQTNWANKQSKT
jgi:hypothetical protein